MTAYPTQCRQDGLERIKNTAHRYDRIVVSGGDGTMSESVNGLMQAKKQVPLAYIPAGTTNDFATSLEIPRNMLEAAKCAVEDCLFSYDVGSLCGKYFCYVAAFGAFTEVSYQTSQSAKNVFGHTAYIFEAIKRIPKLEIYDLLVEHDGETIRGEFLLGLITNTISVGGMKKLAKSGVVFDDGLFEVTLVKAPGNLLELQSLVNKFLFTDISSKYFVTFKTSQLKISCDSEISWTIDGEDGGSYKQAEIQNHKQAIHLVVCPESFSVAEDQPETGLPQEV